MGTIILSALVAHTAWHWMIERWGVLSQFHFQWPELTDAFLASAMRWLMLVIALAGLAWFVFGVLRNRRKSEPQTPGAVPSNTVS